jgi:hypothetical protein
MGYDSGECIRCYCYYHGNNCDDNNTNHNICHRCFLKYCPKGLHGRACLGSYVQVLPDAICDLCEQVSICLYQVAVCENCINIMNPLSKEIVSHKVNYSVCDGFCDCPNCPQSSGRLHSYFRVEST